MFQDCKTNRRACTTRVRIPFPPKFHETVYESASSTPTWLYNVSKSRVKRGEELQFHNPQPNHIFYRRQNIVKTIIHFLAFLANSRFHF